MAKSWVLDRVGHGLYVGEGENPTPSQSCCCRKSGRLVEVARLRSNLLHQYELFSSLR
jgi:hypothetical protein